MAPQEKPTRRRRARKARYPGIYAIRCTVNDKMYIGSAVDIFVRWYGHRFHLNRGTHHSRPLMSAWRKYGPEAFAWEILELVPDGVDLTAIEQKYLDEFRTAERGVGYNISPTAGSCLGVKQSLETIEKLRRPKSPEHLAKVAAANRNRSPEATAAIARACVENNRKRVWSDESRAKLSESLRNRSPEVIARIAASNRGKKKPPEAIAKHANKIRARATLKLIRPSKDQAELPFAE